MKLREFMTKYNASLNDIALMIGTSSEAVRRYANGERMPQPHIMQAIIDATNGKVTANDWFTLPGRK